MLLPGSLQCKRKLIALVEGLHCIGPAHSLPNLGNNAKEAAGDFLFSLQQVDGRSGAVSILIRAPQLHAHLVRLFPARVMMEWNYSPT